MCTLLEKRCYNPLDSWILTKQTSLHLWYFCVFTLCTQFFKLRTTSAVSVLYIQRTGLIQISRTSLTLWFPPGECLLCALQMDIISLFPLEVFYYFTGVNSLLRFPRLLKVRRFFCFVHSWSLWSGWTADLCFPLSVHGFLWVQRQNGICDEESVHL